LIIFFTIVKVYLMKRYAITKDFVQASSIGNGNYSEVFRDSNGKYAIKRTIEKYLNIHLIKEYMILQTFKHIGVIDIHAFYCNYNLGKWDLALVMPVYQMNLRDFYKNAVSSPDYSDRVLHIMKNISLALYAMHERGFLHLDIKPDNILISDQDVRLIDFGISQYVGNIIHQQEWMEVVTIWYRAPELINQKFFDYKVDIWSLGCVLGELIYGKPLFVGDRKSRVLSEQELCGYKTWIPIRGLENLVQLLDYMIVTNPLERKNISRVLKRLGHKVPPITTANRNWLKANSLTHALTNTIDRERQLDHIITTMRYNKCHLQTIINTISWMDLYGNNDDSKRAWMATVENLQENPFTNIYDWAGAQSIVKFENSVVNLLERIRFTPTIGSFTDGTHIELAIVLIVLYNSDYVEYSLDKLGKSIKKIVSDTTGEPDETIEFIMSCLEQTDRSCPVLDIVPDIMKFIDN
jgi:serine/threonine protein kinase